MKKIMKGLLLSALFIPTLVGCKQKVKTITVHADSLYLNEATNGEVYLAQNFEPCGFGETATFAGKNKSITMEVQDDWTYRDVYINNLFVCPTAFNTTEVDTYYDATIMPTRFGYRVCFADTYDGLADYNLDWTRKISGNDVWIRFFRVTSN